MGVLTEFFVANAAELEALAIEWGPMPPPPEPPKTKGGLFGFGKKPVVPDGPLEPYGPTLPALQTRGILNTQIGTLDQFVTGTPYAELEDSGAINAVARDDGGGDDDPWVFPLRRELRDGLAALAEDRIAPVAQQWGEDGEIGATGPEEFADLRDLVRELRDLAQLATETGRDLYLWVSL